MTSAIIKFIIIHRRLFHILKQHRIGELDVNEQRMMASDNEAGGDRAYGPRTIQRASDVLRALSGSQNGMRLSDIAAAASLHKATTHRLLAAMAREGLVEQDERRRYHLGAEIWILGMAAARRFDISGLAATALDRIAEHTGDTAFLSIRSGNQAICIDRREGHFPIRTLTLEVGSRRPLGVGAGSLALLAYLPDQEIKEVIAANRKRLSKYPGFAPPTLWQLIGDARRDGHTFNEGRIVSDMSAVGVAIFGHVGTPAAALSCAAISSRMQEARRREIVTLLREEAERIGARLNPQKRTRDLASVR